MSNAVRHLKKIQSFSFLSYLISIKLKAHIKFGYTTEVLKLTDMWQNADNKLFSLMFRSGHCLHTLLPSLKMIDTCTNNRSSIDVFFVTAVDASLFLQFVFHVFIRILYILFDLIFSPLGL